MSLMNEAFQVEGSAHVAALSDSLLSKTFSILSALGSDGSAFRAASATWKLNMTTAGPMSCARYVLSQQFVRVGDPDLDWRAKFADELEGYVIIVATPPAARRRRTMSVFRDIVTGSSRRRPPGS